MVKDPKWKSIAKAFSWRIMATLITSLIILIYTGEIELAVGIGILDFVLKLILYYLHERIWNKFK